MKNKVFSKVVTAGVGAGAGTVLGTFATWITGIAFGGSAAAADVETTLALAPLPITGLLTLSLAVAGAVIGGYVKEEDPATLLGALEVQGYVRGEDGA